MRTRSFAALCASAVGASVVAVASFGQQQPPAQNPPAQNPPDAVLGRKVLAPTPATKPTDGPRGPVLNGEDGKPISGVSLMKADVKAVISGPLAEAQMTLTFRNETAQVLGGELTFPLPEGAAICGYGLDIDGVMVDGVAVEKQEARVIYEKEIRTKVDPGLIEQVTGNNFRTRLYPIPAHGTRTLKVQYVADLTPGEAGKGASFTMPMCLGEKLEAFDLMVAVKGAMQPPIVRGGGYTSQEFQGTPEGYYLKDSLRDAKAVDALTVFLPEVAGTAAIVQKRPITPKTVEELDAAKTAAADAAKRVTRYESFFLLSDTPPRPPLKQAILAQHHVLVVWDASLSRQHADTARELKLLEQALSKLGNPSVDVALLRNDVEFHLMVGSGAEGTAKVIAFLKGVTYDGGTNLGALAIPKNAGYWLRGGQGRSAVGTTAGAAIPAAAPDIADYDLALLFTDGISSVGQEKPSKVEIPVYAIATDPTANHAALRSLCQSSGGVYLNMQREQDAAAVAAIGEPPFSIIGIECDPAQVAEVTPGVGTAVGGRVTVAGKLLTPEAKVTLVYGFGKTETSRQSFALKASEATEETQIARFWAQQKAAELALAGEAKRDELVKLGKSFNLVTPGTSLLVLETADQYARYGIVPPTNRAEVYKQFMEQVGNRKVVEANTKEEKVQQVLSMWDERKVWWGTEFKYAKDLKVNDQPEGGLGGLVAADAAAVPPAPATQPGGLAQFGPPHGPAANGRPATAAPAPAQGGPVGGVPNVGTGGQPATPQPNTPARPTPTGGGGRAGERRQTDEVPNFNDAPDFDLTQQRPGGPGGGGGGASGGNAGGGSNSLFGSASTGAKDSDNGGSQDEAPSIRIQTWDPQTPYIAAMKAVATDKAYDVYLAQREKYSKSPAFYFDCADYLIHAGQRSAGIRVLTDIAELKLDDARLLGVAAHRLNQLGETDMAIDLFEKVLKLRPEEPQSFRDLALALASRADAAADSRQKNGETGRIASDYGRALELLNKVVTGNWDRFPEIEVVALMEANQILAKLSAMPNLGEIPIPLDKRLIKNLDCDVRIVLTWDADATDIDLWVTEPSGEVCMYNHNRTTIGGAMSRDFTDGYGPEEYVLRKTMPGEYKIQANFYGSQQQELTGPCTVQATVITNFGRPNEKREAMTLRLAETKEVVTVGTVTLGGGAATTRPAELNK